MKKTLILLFAVVLVAAGSLTLSSCNRGSGCPINEKAHVQPNKKGNYPKSKTRSGLFPKGMGKRG
jgi:predicted small secreted protein